MRGRSLIYLLFIAALSLTHRGFATHIMGGEITWECLDNGQYIFTLKVYRDCNGVTFNTNGHALEAHNFPTLGAITQIPLTFFSVTDITPSCEGSPCATLTQADPDIPGAIEEYVLKSDSTTLNGVPGANGWIFSWTFGNRNAAIDNIVNAQNFGITLRAKMFAYNGQDAGNCFDSSPDFFQKPSTIICGGEKFTYNHSAFDRELDSLHYSWADPLDGNFCNNPPCLIGALFQEATTPTVLNFDGANGYTYDSPFPDTSLDNRNVPAVLDSSNGEITFTSFTTGEFVSVIKVEAFKCGVKVAEIYRELQTVITTGCASNEPPEIPSPFADGTFSDTVIAGDFVEFDIDIFDTLRTDNPKDDSIFFFASGMQFGQNFTDSLNGCLNPPCATLSRPAPDTGVASYSTKFRWQTTCDHLANNTPNCAITQNTHLFVIRVLDDFCPAAGQKIASFNIVILEKERVQHPDIFCANVDIDGNVDISWEQTADPDTSFEQWMIYRSTNRSGPYSLIDSLINYDSTSYIDSNANANNQGVHYIVRAKSGCHQNWFFLPTDTISSIFVNPIFNDTCVSVSWNAPDVPLPNNSSVAYDVFREYPIGTGFSLYKTQASTFFCDTFSVCTDTVTYRIEISNSGSICNISTSNLMGIRFQHPLPNVDAGGIFDMCTGQSITIGGSPSGPPGSTYSWTPSDSINDTSIANPIVNPSDTASYVLSVIDTNNCQQSDTVVVNVLPSPVSNAGIDDTVCVQNFPYLLNGVVSQTSTGRWLGGTGSFSPDRNTLNAGYTPSSGEINVGQVNLFLITTNNGICDTDTSNFILSIESFSSNISLTTNDVMCNGLDNGTAKVSLAGGSPPFQFQWNTNNGIQTGDSVSNLSNGNFDLTITNQFGCDSVVTFTINQPSALSTSTSTSNNVSCNGLNDGKAFVTASGGTNPYSYLWSNNQTSDTTLNLSAGTYTVTVTDDNGCSIVDSITITEPLVLASSFAASSDVSCNGGNDGMATVSASGGTLPYSYLWSDNQTNDTAFNLTAGTYTVTVTDANNCSDSSTINIQEPQALSSDLDSSDVSCNAGSDGYIVVRVNGGVMPYSYSWNNTQNTDSIAGLTAGTYTVTITDNNSCTLIDSIQVNEPTLLSSSSNIINHVSCQGLSDGRAFVTPSGGTPPYSYSWNNGQVSDTINNLIAASYFVTITDDNACTVLDTVVIIEPSALSTNTSASNNVSCNGLSDGKAFVTASGGTNPYSYLWSNNQTSDTTLNLSAGTYTVTVTDDNGCSIVDSITITEPLVLASSFAASSDVSCNGGNDGMATVSASGGTLPYSYLWSDNQTNDTAFNLTAGTYTVTVTDANNCSDSSTINIQEPQALSSDLDSSDVSCNAGSDGYIVVRVNGGVMPYSYSWNNTQNTDSIAGLTAGTYTVTITDNNSCTLIDSIQVNEPTLLSSSSNIINHVSCQGLSDGRAFVTPSGGTPPYSYSWNNGQVSDTINNLIAASYFVTITDDNACTVLDTVVIIEPSALSTITSASNNVSCNGLSDGKAFVTASGGTNPYSYLWSNNQTSDTTLNLSAGTYTVTVTDDNGCSIVDSITITEPLVLASSFAASSDVSCNGGNDGMATVSASGGTLPYSYLWSDNQTNDTAFNLTAGTYTVTVTDANNCSDSSTISIQEPQALSSDLDSSDVSCNAGSDGYIVVRVNGGVMPYSYSWNNTQNTDSIAGLTAGTYTVTITDNNSCTLIDSIQVNEPTLLSSSSNIINHVSCQGLSDGRAFVTPSGGTPPYSYSWNNGQVSDTINNLIAASYFVTITDDNACTVLDTVVIIEPSALSTNTSASNNVSCNGLSDGKAFVTASGGTNPYSYLWSNNQTSDTTLNLSAGTYTVTVTDDNGCSIVDSITITEPLILASSFAASSDVSCNGGNDGMATVSASGGTLPYSYLWSDNQTNDTAFNLTAGTYTVTVTDDNNCFSSAIINISEPEVLSLNLDEQDVTCFGFNNGSIRAITTGGSLPINYTWNNAQTSEIITNLSPGTYDITITDANGCMETSSTEILEPNPISLTITEDDTICINTNRQIKATARGGAGNFIFTWNNNLGNDSIINVSPIQNTTYIVSVTDQNFCPFEIDSSRVTVNDLFSSQLVLSSSGNICTGDSSLLSYTFDGQFPPYTFIWNQGLTDVNPQYVSPSSSTTYRVTVFDVCNNSISDEVLVEVSDPPPININDTLIEGCEDLVVQFSNGTSDNLFYNWNFGDGNSSTLPNPIHTYRDPGSYSVSFNVSTPEACQSNFEGNYQITVRPKPLSEIFTDKTITDITEPIIMFSGSFLDAITWSWDFGNGFSVEDSASINVAYSDTGTYVVSLIEENQFSCLDTAFQIIKIEPNFTIKIPNAFTPDPNGPNGGSYNPNSLDNTVFHPFIDFVEEYRLMVFNRWGELLFESKDVNIGWDGYYKGELSPSDVYVYKLEVTFAGGEEVSKVGDITLLR